MTSRETCDVNFDDQDRRDFVLRRPSRVGPWVAVGLGVTLVAFLGYLVYINLLLPRPLYVSLERSLHSEAALASPVSHPKRAVQSFSQPYRPATTVVPQGRAPHALLGGQGPALLPEQVLTLIAPPSPQASAQTSIARP